MTLKDGDIVYIPYVNPVHDESTGKDMLTGETWGSTKYSVPTCVASYIGKGKAPIVTREGHIPALICETRVRVTDGEIDFIAIRYAKGLYEDELWMR